MLSSNTHLHVVAPISQLSNIVTIACIFCQITNNQPITHFAIVKAPSRELNSHLNYKELAEFENAQDTLLLFTYAAPEASPLPWPQKPASLDSFIESWLANTPEAPEDYHFDGSIDPNGFLLITNQYGKLAGSHHAILAIQKQNLEYAK